jgi:hypothetical protein
VYQFSDRSSFANNRSGFRVSRRERWQIKFNGTFPVTISRTAVAASYVRASCRRPPPLTSRPTEGVCNVPLIFHIESGRYGDVALDGLNVALAIHTPGPMAEGNWSVAAYIDQRADDKQTAALGAIFTGAAGGPMAAFAPLIGKNLGVKKAPITFRIEGKKRSAEIPGVLHMSLIHCRLRVRAGRCGRTSVIRSVPKGWRFAVGAPGNTFTDHGMRWDNSGKNGHYAPIRWSNQS